MAVVLLVAATAGSGCSADKADKEEAGFAGALSRIAATDLTKAQISYDDTAALRKLVGDGPPGQGFGILSLIGGSNLAGRPEIEAATHVAPRRGTYNVSAGRETRVTLVAGGQKGKEVSAALTKLGWQRKGDRLVAPDVSAVDKDTATYAIEFGQVRVDGADIVYGSSSARLADVGRPSGDTLADDARIKGLAGCLGDVVAAEIFSASGRDEHTAVAVGVQRPKSNTDTPRAVVCVSWGSQAAAERYAAKATDALANGTVFGGRKLADLVQSTEVTTVGGGEHIVRWRGDTPSKASLVFDLLTVRDLPGLRH